MAPLDLSADLTELDAEAPAGPNLEFDAAFGALERAGQGKPEQQYGGTIIPAEEPEWKEVAAQAAALSERTHDLRVLLHLAVARLHLQGDRFEGLADFVAVLGMIRQLLETRWAHVHPQLDPEDDNDPTLRANALLRLAHPTLVLRVLRDLPLAVSKRDGPITWRMIAVAAGTADPLPDQDRKTEPVIRAAFIDTGAATLGERCATISQGIAHATAIPAAFDANAGFGTGPELDPLIKLLQEMRHDIDHYMPPPDAAPAQDDSSDTESVAPMQGGMPGDTATGAAQAGGGAVTAAALKSVTTRADAVRLLDLVCRYYEEYEPSSPLPLLIGRARRLADKGFMEILQDLAPDGVMQAQTVVQSRDP